MLVSGVQQSVLFIITYVHMASLVAQLVKSLPAVRESQFDSSIRKVPWRTKWQPPPVFLPGIPWTEELGGLQFMESQRIGHS